MKIVTKETNKTIVEKTTAYVAEDGTEFTNSEQCRIYENSAKCVLKSKLKECLISSNSEYNIYGAGSDDYIIYVYYPTTQAEKDVLLQYYYLINGSNPNTWHVKELIEDLEKDNVHYMFGTDCDNDLYYLSTVEDRLATANNLLYGIKKDN